MRKLTLIAALSALATPLFAQDAALLMGVNRYEEFRRVGNGTDVLNSADNLRDAGYAVSTLANGSATAMARLLQRFAVDAVDAERLVVGLAGRFVTDGERTWLLPADADRPTLFGMGSAISVDSVLQVLAQTPGQAILILGYDQDADNRIGSYLRQGVGDLDIPQGVTVFYGEPDFTDGVVMEAITVPGGDAMAFARNSRGLREAGYQPQSLIMRPASEETEADPDTSIVDGVRNALAAWNAAQAEDSADSYRDYVFAYPDSPFAAEARRRLDAIENDPQRLAEIAEDQLDLTRNERRAIQRNLTVLDFNTRGVDGIFGPGTRSAIRNWQQTNGYAQTGFVTQEQIDRLDTQARRRAEEIEEQEAAEQAELERLDRAYWEETGALGEQDGYEAYLERYPNGIFAEEAREALQRSEDSTQAARDRERALNINPVLGRLIESRLAQLGFNPGRVDGRFDRDSRRAISRYQASNGLSATGYLDEPTLARLLADTFGR
ncbi:peptidoglycan-binding protein [Cognatiyoonia sp. IB215182]|uniref:peptidoglycan-binding domain-containing protein n=1 Tax=Cognatiyoonia sp. IB215182 TaxID=3097353 RepID=UPI002A132028|nr:peptidoglycan-binding protein [Cognatiyoonia sp. IB215182]MDX8352600.1 peptidoglycan-binding protein [Cognatiyoonia sp. IB215182]